MFYQGNWIDSFPDNYQWSNATSITKGMAPWNAVALGEIDEVIQRLHQRAGEPHAWWEEWCAMGARMERFADAAAADNRQATAGNYYLRAGMYYYTGERMVSPGEQKTGIYKKSLHCAHEGLKRRHKNIEFVEVPYEGASLPAYFMKSPVAPARAPTVVLFDGLDNCKEMSVLFGGYSAPRMAAFEKRYRACVAWGALFDYHATWEKRLKLMQAEGAGNKQAASAFSGLGVRSFIVCAVDR